MIVKNLRKKNHWSQEQLADLCGLNVRTIQRVENGNQASIETLKSLASVFEVNISTLTEEITVIDKESNRWKDLPWWYRANMVGIRTRRPLVVIECLLLILAFVFLPLGDPIRAIGFLIGAYVVGLMVRYTDHLQVW